LQPTPQQKRVPALQTAIKSKHVIRSSLTKEVIASDITSCYTCGSCLTDCPVNLATDSLHPRSLVRMVPLGFIEELVHSREIWYCISCGRCERACPMGVRPARLISAIRLEAYNSGVLAPDRYWRLRSVYSQLHRVRRQVVDLCFKGEPIPDLTSEWRRLAEAPLNAGFEKTQQPVRMGTSWAARRADIEDAFNSLHGAVWMSSSEASRRASRNYLGFATNVDLCLTCAECSNACPVSCGRVVFDPMWINRMAAFGFFEEILRDPSIWLCIKCQSCAMACPHEVKTHLLISRLQELATEKGFIDPALLLRWWKVERLVYRQFIREIDIVCST
jgi:heterodisulfide reductase subunit C